jgi:hypothetical protein
LGVKSVLSGSWYGVDWELTALLRLVLHGEASGEVLVANETPVLKAGKRKVIDRVGKRAVISE